MKLSTVFLAILAALFLTAGALMVAFVFLPMPQQVPTTIEPSATPAAIDPEYEEPWSEPTPIPNIENL